MKVIERFRIFATLPFCEKLYLLKMALIVASIEIGLRLFGMKKIVGFLGKQSKITTNTIDIDETIEQRKKVIFSMQLFFPFACRCLARSLTAWWLLRRHGIETNLKVGIQKKDGKVVGHAWLEHNEKPLDDKDTVHLYTVFDDFALSKFNLG